MSHSIISVQLGFCRWCITFRITGFLDFVRRLNTRKQNVSETGSVSVLRWGEDSVGSLRRANLNHWTNHVSSFKLRCNRRSVSQFSSWYRASHLVPITRFLLLSDICGLRVVGPPPWREVYNVLVLVQFQVTLGSKSRRTHDPWLPQPCQSESESLYNWRSVSQ
jgi:hypothetical protein